MVDSSPACLWAAHSDISRIYAVMSGPATGSSLLLRPLVSLTPLPIAPPTIHYATHSRHNAVGNSIWELLIPLVAVSLGHKLMNITDSYGLRVLETGSLKAQYLCALLWRCHSLLLQFLVPQLTSFHSLEASHNPLLCILFCGSLTRTLVNGSGSSHLFQDHVVSRYSSLLCQKQHLGL